jgi:hypothetical protein
VVDRIEKYFNLLLENKKNLLVTSFLFLKPHIGLFSPETCKTWTSERSEASSDKEKKVIEKEEARAN